MFDQNLEAGITLSDEVCDHARCILDGLKVLAFQQRKKIVDAFDNDGGEIWGLEQDVANCEYGWSLHVALAAFE